ncbi:MAG: aspartate--tRNA ligase [Candidatus Parvarchaeota archaeon]|nr:aspartate--tRNA ligase [Candidatus Parvarchaeota archaeon]
MEADCGKVRDHDEGKKVVLNGWCRYIRDHGGLLFVDLTDRYGTTQLVFDGNLKKEAEELGKEYVISVEGTVRKREKDTVDPSNPTGNVEVRVESFRIINKSKVLPFEITEEKEKFLPSDDLRLKYRYLDLRRRRMVNNIEFRDKLTKTIRKFFWSEGFLDLETPILVKDTYDASGSRTFITPSRMHKGKFYGLPTKTIRKFFWGEGFLELETPILVKDTYDASGSRTFITPSRMHKGKFYGLPQSPQVYKQLSMIAGLDKYFQVAKVFRDEDPREDRQPEFTQIDLEVSFKDEKYIQGLIEAMFKKVFEEVMEEKIELPFPHMDYLEAMERYGSDKPDTRFDNVLFDLTEELSKSDYNIIKKVISAGGKVKALKFSAEMGRKSQKIDKKKILELVEIAKNLGLKGLTWLYVIKDKIESDPPSIAASLSGVSKQMMSKLDAKDGDLILIGSDPSENILLAAMSRIGRIVGLVLRQAKKKYAFLWVDKFPLFEKDEVTGELQPMHNPFVAPTEETKDLIDSAPEKVLGKRYDLVLNGMEIGGGSIRIHNPDMQKKVLSKMGLSEEEIERSLGFLIEALSFGAPVHGGIALGFDRVVATLSGEYDIRDFILFPKNRRFESPLDGSPDSVSDKRLQNDYDLSVKNDKKS